MLTLYTDLDSLYSDFVRPNIFLVRDADSFFNQRVKSGEIKISDCERFVEMLSSERGELRKMSDMLKLSTSCKTLILADKYPDIVLSNQNISAEASDHLLNLFSDRNQAFLFYPNRQNVKFSLLVGNMGCKDAPTGIVDFDDEITATVVSGYQKKVCNNYSEIFRTLYEFAGPEENLFPRHMGSKKEENIELGEGGIKLCKVTKRMGNRTCERETCPYRIQPIVNGFIFGGQFICRSIYDSDLNKVLELASPFGVKPTDEQIDKIFDYAYETGLISFDGADEEDEICYSDAIIQSLALNNQAEHEIAGYFITEDGTPQLEGVFLPNKEKKKIIEEDFTFGFGLEDEEEVEPEEYEEEYEGDEEEETEEGEAEEEEDDFFLVEELEDDGVEPTDETDESKKFCLFQVLQTDDD